MSSARAFLRMVCGLALLGGLLLGGTGCQSNAESGLDIVADLSDRSYALVDQDSSAVSFPDAYRGEVLVVGTIYTHCPDICSMITANMKTIRQQMASTDGVRFVTVTFDPRRDAPSTLSAYRRSFRIADDRWAFLTGDTTAVHALMRDLDVRHRAVTSEGTPVAPDTAQGYLINHTDQITLIDARGRIRGEYSGSRTPPDMLIEDINNLRS